MKAHGGGGGVGAFKWSPDGKSIAYSSSEPKTEADKDREKTLGEFDVIGEGYRMSHLWVFDVASRKSRRLTSGAFTVGSFDWSPDGTQIAFDHRINPANTSGATADISVVTVADAKIRKLVDQEGADSGPIWSPDGTKIAFGSAMKKPFSFLNNAIAVIPASGGAIEAITTAFDESPSLVDWNRGGLFFTAAQRTWSYLFSIDPATKAIRRYTPSEQWIGSGFSLTPDGRWTAFSAADASTLSEIYVAPVATTLAPRKLTDMTAQTAGWANGAHEVISWKSQDGATDRRRAAQAGRFSGRTQVPAARRHSRRADRGLASHRVLQHVDLPDRHLDGEGGAGARTELPRQRGLRRSLPLAERAQPRRR